MTLAAGTRLGPYEIVGPLGAGGMGEVYRARDTRLDRTVAIKVLPPHLSENPDHRRRFEREAKMISALSHPHICALHDVGHQDGTDYLVMELVDGETLSERLVKGPLPTEQVLRYGIEIADALDKAHRQGIVHRDLKPGNVMLTRSGVKLLDFGLAKMRLEEATAGVSVSLLATRTSADRSPLTEKGTILGTFQYMAPEQLEGKEADARSDLFAFGAVLYEMATGQKAFTGKTQASLIGAILHTEPPPISSVQPLAPPTLDRVVKTCLAKDPEDRWQTAHDVKLQLRAIAETGSQANVTAVVAPLRRPVAERLLWLANAVTLAAVALLGFALYRATRPTPQRLVVSSVDVPEKTSIAFDSGAPLLSPDGRKLAVILSSGGGRTAVWLRSLDGSTARLIAGTEGAVYPFWSPDSRHLAFFADGKLRKVNVESGGPADTVADAPLGRGGTWNREGDIVFAPDTGGTLFRVSSSGGAATPVTIQDEKTGEISHRYPSFLPDGRHFVYEVQVGGGGSQYKHFIGSLDPKEKAFRLPFESESNVVYSFPEHLLFVQQGNLRAQPFDVRSLRPAGESFAVADLVQVSSIVGFGSFSVSDDGLLAYVGGAAARFSKLVWTDRAGKELETVGTPAVHWDPRLSHDGRRLAFAIEDSRGNSDIWIYDVARKISTRFTFDPDADLAPVWAPDDDRIVFTAYRRGPGDLFQKLSTGSGAEELLLASPNRKIATDFSPDGRVLAFHTNQPKTSWNIFTLAPPARNASVYLDGPFPELAAGFSPDGRWVAYVSAESGVGEVYVQSFPKGAGKWQISSGGGAMPIWRRDGKELFFLASDGKLMAVGVKTGGTFEAERPESLFSASVRNFVGLSRRQYDVTADGQRFILNAAVEEQGAAPITLVQNWTAKAPR